MIEFYKTFGTMTKKIDKPEKGCWISAIAPTQEECDYLIQEIGVLPEFVKASLDEEESSHIGLKSVRKMLSYMNATLVIQEVEDIFIVQLVFPLSMDGLPKA